MSFRPRILAAVLAATAVVALSAGSAGAGTDRVTTSSAECAPGSRGRLTSAVPLVRMSAAEVSAELGQVGLPDGARHGIAAHRLTYCTTSPSGRMTTAGGLLVLPQAGPDVLTPVLYEHSSAAARTEAPSYLRETEIRVIPFFFASDGFAVVAPDYLGLGSSPGRHPYLHAASEASSSVDMMRAAETAVRRQGARLSHDLFVTGFSQGGHAAMATGQALQRSPGPWHLTALAPMAGPYAMSGAMAAAILDPARSDQQHAAFYTADVLTAWNDLYHLYDDPREVFTAPYADMVEGLYDGDHGVVEIDAAAGRSSPGAARRSSWTSATPTTSGRRSDRSR